MVLVKLKVELVLNSLSTVCHGVPMYVYVYINMYEEKSSRIVSVIFQFMFIRLIK